MECPACGSSELVLLGQLGTLIHLRCRHCGMNSSTPAEEVQK